MDQPPPAIPPDTELFDARPMLSAGEEPFSAIQARWDALSPGACLVVRSPFLAAQLIAYFSSLGVQARPHSPAPGDFWLLLGPKA